MVGTMTPPHDPSSPMDGGIRKRVCKACDRCRLKKSKCDGASPCSRCKADNAICFFGERKKSHDKVYPKGYVEMLENQQAQLVTGLQELYRRLQHGQGWEGSPLKETPTGSPLTHDILERLGALKQEGQSTAEPFEESLEAMQQRLIASGAGFMPRDTSFDSNSEFDSNSTFESSHHKSSPSFINPFQPGQFPPTPPTQSPHQRTVHTSSPLKSQFSADMSQFGQFSNWSSDFDDSMDFMTTYEPATDLNMDAMAAYASQVYSGQTAINPCLTMKNWDAQQELQKYFNSNVLV